MEVYILQSEKFYRFYVGISKNAENGLKKDHNKGKVKSTKNWRPWKLIYKKIYKTCKEAREMEKYLKSYKGVKIKKEIIEKYQIK
jgi:putative endonuclease